MIRLNWHAAMLLIGVVQGVFFAFALWTKRENTSANRFLALFELAFATILLYFFFFESRLALHLSNEELLLWPTIYLLGPFYWWYTRCLTKGPFVFDQKERLHLIPMIISLVLFLPFISWNAIPDYSALFLIIENIVYYGLMVHGAIYLFLSYRIVREHNRLLSNSFSFEEGINLRWLNNLTLFFFVAWVMFLMLNFFPITTQPDVIFDMSLIAIVFAIGYFATRQPALIAEVPALAVTGNGTVSAKYQSSTLSTAQAAAIEQRLLTHMTMTKPYREGKLTLSQLADQLNVLPNYLSQVINERLECNFFDFVNQYRITEAQQRLLDEPDRTILDIALDSGFNSKSAFYKEFKQRCGTTPTQFRNSRLASSPK